MGNKVTSMYKSLGDLGADRYNTSNNAIKQQHNTIIIQQTGRAYASQQLNKANTRTRYGRTLYDNYLAQTAAL